MTRAAATRTLPHRAAQVLATTSRAWGLHARPRPHAGPVRLRLAPPCVRGFFFAI